MSSKQAEYAQGAKYNSFAETILTLSEGISKGLSHLNAKFKAFIYASREIYRLIHCAALGGEFDLALYLCFTFVWLYLLAVYVRCLCPSMVLVFCSLIKGVRSVRCLSINYGFILEG